MLIKLKEFQYFCRIPLVSRSILVEKPNEFQSFFDILEDMFGPKFVPNREKGGTEIRASFSINPSPFLIDFGAISGSKKLSKTASERSQKDSRFRCRFWADLEPIWQKQFSRTVEQLFGRRTAHGP